MSTGFVWRKDGYAEKVSALMTEMGSKKGFDPMPPSQHAWPMRRPGSDPLMRFWAWMCDKTIRRGHRWPYAVSTNGRPLHIKDAAHDLGMDEGNARKVWREGEVLGLWHRGSGRFVERMYFNGEVIPLPFPNTGEEKENGTSMYKLLPPYILKQIKDWPEERISEVHQRYDAHEKLREQVQADLLSASRIIFDADEDTMWRDLGIKKIREKHQPKNGKGEELATRRDRVQSILPGLQNFVQTFRKSVQGDSGELLQTSAETTEPQTGVENSPIPAAAPESLSRGSSIPEAASASSVDLNSPSGGRASSVVSGPPAEEPPARPPDDPPESQRKPVDRAPEWHARLRTMLEDREIFAMRTPLDEPMFQRIARPLSEELLDQFKAVSTDAKNIRKWSGYEGIAKQVGARGVVKATAAGAGQEESFLERRAREIDAARKGKRNG